jgi:hypothetical protein
LPFVPTGAIKIVVIAWILIPHHEGEKIAYQIMKGRLESMEMALTSVKSRFFDYIIQGVLVTTDVLVTKFKRNTSY